MSLNLLDLVKDQVTGQLAKSAAGFLGESESGVTKALGGIFPSILGSVISKGANESGAKGLLDMIGGVDSSLLGNIGGLLGGGKSDALMSVGSSLLSGLLGNKLGGAVDLISKVSGLKSGSTMNLFKMAAPLLMGLIGKQVSKNNLGVSGLMSLLSNQKSHVEKALPAGMGSLMGLGSLLSSAKDAVSGAATGAANTVSAVASSASSTASRTAEKVTSSVKTGGGSNNSGGGGGMWKWLIPAVLLLGALYFLTQSSMCAGAKDKVESVGDSVATGAKKVGNAVGDGAKAVGGAVADGADAVVDGAKTLGGKISAAFSNVNKEAKALLDKITFTEGSAGDQMRKYIAKGSGNAVFRFKNLKFATGSAKIDAASAREIEDIAAILKAYPGVNVEIQGYTDNTGDAAKNVTLSKARAESVRARLGAEGIAANRITAQGFGSANPVDTNDTAEGRAQNRRIEVKVTN